MSFWNIQNTLKLIEKICQTFYYGRCQKEMFSDVVFTCETTLNIIDFILRDFLVQTNFENSCQMFKIKCGKPCQS